MILAAGLARRMLQFPHAVACSCFAAAIFENNLLTFVNASAVSFPAGMLPFSAVASCCAATMTWGSSEMVGFGMYWCLKCTMLLTLVALVFVMYTQKQ